ncbi:MAG: hypothetical protein U5N86_08250 [Planctomycetota bacterium]|nr:hypothetical protein [Planctomycetota bacterium]
MTLDCSGSYSPEGGTKLFWRFFSGPACRLEHGADGIAAFMPRFAGTYRLQAVAQASGKETTATTVVRVTSPNRPPTVRMIGPSSARANERVTFTAEVSDPDQDPLLLEWSARMGRELIATATGDTLTFTPGKAEQCTVELSVNDGYAEPVKTRTVMQVTQPAEPPKLDIVIEPSSPRTDEDVLLDASASTPAAAGELSFSWTQVSGPPVPPYGEHSAKVLFRAAFRGRVLPAP